jgi:alpha-D-xyloside xylohydrolase
MVTQQDYTVMRALVMDFGKDNNVLNIGDQFMFGPAVLINPITEYKVRNRNVYLPSGANWYELRTGKLFEGGRSVQADAPYSDIPIFIRAGSIIPCGPEIQYTAEKNADTVRLFVYTGSSGSFTLYEDENINYNYEKGLFSTIKFSYNEKKHELTIGKRSGSFPGMLKKRKFEIVWISSQKPSGLDFNSKPDAAVSYNGDQQSIKIK